MYCLLGIKEKLFCRKFLVSNMISNDIVEFEF